MSQLLDDTLVDFTGGINVRRNDFNLSANESPRMLNIEVDPRGGFFTRRGWQRWSEVGAIDPTWNPRAAELHALSSGAYEIFLANNGKVWDLGPNGIATDTGLTATANPHLADFAPWGDTMYFALGRNGRSAKTTQGVTTELDPDVSVPPTFNDDYTTPTDGVMPQAEHATAHAGYLFIANLREGNAIHPNRLRWSHPGRPENWHSNDYIDISEGGGYITALMPYQDHLLIFKTNSVWALYGYDSASWQLIKVSRSVGAATPGAVTRSETAIYFYSGSGRSGIYAYAGEGVVHLTEKLRTVMENIQSPEEVWVTWVGRRLWTSLPWSVDPQRTHTNFVFDPEVGNGAWVAHQPAEGNMTVIIERADLSTDYPLGIIRDVPGQTPIVRLDFLSQAADDFGAGLVPFECYYTTGWRYANMPELRKSWRRPRMIVREPIEDLELQIDTFWDYEEDAPRRRHVLFVDSDGTSFWRLNGAADPDGFDWGDGTLWGDSTEQGSDIERAQPPGGLTGLGLARSVQLRFQPAEDTKGKAWGVDAMVLKYRNRRFTS